MNTKDIRRAWLLSDIHLGVHSSRVEWVNIILDYFDNFFIPLVKKNIRQGDALFILGDIFENRQSVDIFIINETMKLFKRLAPMLDVYILIGNHDCYMKNSVSINSPMMLSEISGVHIIDDITEFDLAFDRKCVFIPWVNDKEEMAEILKTHKGDYLFVHEDFSGMKNTSKTKVPGGLPYALVNNYTHVYSGHIHFRQKINNVTMVGNPMQTSFSDVDNDKGVYLLDFEDMTEKFFVNDYSPKHIRLDYADVKTLDKKEVQSLVENNFVQINVSTADSMSLSINEFMEDIEGHKKISFITEVKDTDDVDDEEDEELENAVVENKSMNELIDDYVDGLEYNTKIKDKLKQVAKRFIQESAQ